MSYPTLKYSMQIWPENDTHKYVLECVRTIETNGWDYGRLFVQVLARGKREAWREVKKEGPTYKRVLNTRGTCDRFEDMRPDAEWNGE